MAVLGMAAVAAAPAATPDEQILKYLDQTLDWYRRVTAIDDPASRSSEVILRSTVRQSARQTLRLGFQFARAEAEILTAAPGAGTSATAPAAATGRAARPNDRLMQAAATAGQRSARLEAQLEQIDRQISAAATTAPASRPAVLTARRDKVLAELDLAKARQRVLEDLATFAGGPEGAVGGANALLARVEELQRSVPEAQAEAASAAPGTGTNAAATTQPVAAPAVLEAPHPDTAGLIGQVTEMFALSRRMRELKELTDQANLLRQENQKLREPIRTELMEAIRRGDALGAAGDADNDPARLEAQRQELGALASRFRRLSAAGVPLSEQARFLDTARDNLLEWRAALARQYSTVLRRVLVRLVGLAIAAAVIFGLSALWRRATFRYVHDPRRRRQLLLVRRIIVGCVLLAVAVATFVSELGSLATFAGIMTAGIAVALQTFILSGVAYFFFIGRYGVRVGDRVTVGGITGEVIETGLFRLYLMELGGADKLRPSGRIVVFSNSVLFQPSGFFKQLPGAEFVYHEVALTLSPETDHGLAEQRLMAAVQEVYDEYRPEIERQHAAAKAAAHLPLPAPKLEGRLRFVDDGLEFIVRYPVELVRGAEIDDRVTRKLLAAIEAEPKLKLVAAGTPKIQPAG